VKDGILVNYQAIRDSEYHRGKKNHTAAAILRAGVTYIPTYGQCIVASGKEQLTPDQMVAGNRKGI